MKISKCIEVIRIEKNAFNHYTHKLEIRILTLFFLSSYWGLKRHFQKFKILKMTLCTNERLWSIKMLKYFRFSKIWHEKNRPPICSISLFFRFQIWPQKYILSNSFLKMYFSDFWPWMTFNDLKMYFFKKHSSRALFWPIICLFSIKVEILTFFLTFFCDFFVFVTSKDLQANNLKRWLQARHFDV